MVGIVIVSHSARLAEGVAELAIQMAGAEVAIVAAGGLDLPGQPLGTDAALVARAVEQAWAGDGVLVLMDLGSAVLSAEMALDMLPGELRPGVLLCEAPLVEGAVAAAVAARLGEPLDRVAAEARGGLAGKIAHLSASPGGDPGAALPGAALPGAEAAGPAGDALEARLTVTIPLGLHARPAARFVETAGRFDAAVTAQNLTTGAGPASARSLNGVATLGVRQGHEVLVRATGPQARQALDALRALAAGAFGEPAAGAGEPAAVKAGTSPAAQALRAPEPAAPVTPGAPAASEGPVTGGTLSGLAASPGIGLGPARMLRPAPVTVPREPAPDPQSELRRLDAALAAARRDAETARDSVAARAGAYAADIFAAHLLFLSDEALLGPARALIGEGHNAADAWDRAVAGQAAAWRRLEDAYQRERVRDLESVGAQVLGHLLWAGRRGQGQQSEGRRGQGQQSAGRRGQGQQSEGGPGQGQQNTGRPEVSGTGVVVAADLSPADTAGLDPAVVRGIATALGGPASHTAILARALGIPAVVGLGAAVLAVPEGTLLLLDGELGTVAVAPGDAEVAAARRARARRRAAAARARKLAGSPAVTRDGTPVEVAANAGSVADARAAVAAGADGIGLLRTEFVFASAPAMPTEQEQEAVYRAIAEILDGRPLTVRTLDVGADKPLAYLPREAEPNPALGQRGIRLGLARTDLLLPQIRAVLRVAADHPVRLMFPMVATEAEVTAALRLVNEAGAGLGEDGVPVPAPGEMEVGIMIEVPSAALTAPALAGAVGFFSVGTNDLSQYTLAADRQVTTVARLADAMHPAVLSLIGRAAAASAGAGRWTGVCGELAADPLAVPLLLGLGVRELSVGPASVAAVKQAVRRTELPAATELARRAIALPSAEAVRDLASGRRHPGMGC